MKFIKPSYEILSQNPGIEGIYEAIERAGRVCYKSTRKEGTTAKDFVNKMIASKHLAVLEHGTVYLMVQSYAGTNSDVVKEWKNTIKRYIENPYSKVVDNGVNAHITSNLRVLYENNWLDDLKYLCEPTEYHEKRITVKFVSMIQFYKDLTRHRKMSYCIESTRYCDYSKGRFGNELTFIIPSWLDIPEGSYKNLESNMKGFYARVNGRNRLITEDYRDYEYEFLYALQNDEKTYLTLIKNGYSPQQAAKLLPQDTKADIIVTGFVSDWSHIFSQRTSIIAETGQPDTEVSLLMNPLYNEFKNRNLI